MRCSALAGPRITRTAALAKKSTRAQSSGVPGWLKGRTRARQRAGWACVCSTGARRMGSLVLSPRIWFQTAPSAAYVDLASAGSGRFTHNSTVSPSRRQVDPDRPGGSLPTSDPSAGSIQGRSDLLDSRGVLRSSRVAIHPARQADRVVRMGERVAAVHEDGR